MPIIVEENQKGKLKRRQSYRSQRENTSEDSNGYDEADGMKYGGMKKKKMKKLKTKKAALGMMLLGKKMKEENKPMPIAGAASMAKLDVMKKMLGMKYGGMHKKKKVIKANQGGINIHHFASDVDNKKLTIKQLAEKAKILFDQRNKQAETKEKFRKIKEEREKEMREYNYKRKKPLIDEIAKRRTATEGSFKTGGMSKARGTGCAIRGTNFKGIF